METHLIILWPNAIQQTKKVTNIIEKYFSEKKILTRSFKETDLIKSICRIYEINKQKAVERLSIAGRGKVRIFIVHDNKPIYKKIWRLGTGYVDTNINIANCKTELREYLGHPFLVHSSNDNLEAKKDIRILLGNNYNKNDDFSEECFHSDIDVFNYLNDVDHYLVLRDYSPGDIDILTRKSPQHYANVLNYQHQRLRFIKPLDNLDLSPIDIVNVHHGIFCPIWCENMLINRVFDNGSGRFRPENENLLFSLLYHYILHKPSVPQIGKELMFKLINKLKFSKLANINFENKNDGVYHLIKFLKRNNYSVPTPLDRKMFIDSNVFVHLKRELGFQNLFFDPQKENSIRQDVNDIVQRNKSKKEIKDWIEKKEFNLFDFSKQLLNRVNDQSEKFPGTKAVRRYNPLLDRIFLDTIRVPFNLNNKQVNHNLLMKVYYSEYDKVLKSVENSLKQVSSVDNPYLGTPIIVKRKNNLLITIESHIENIANLRNFLSETQSEDNIAKIATGLDKLKKALNNASINHCDIHPANILVNKDFECTLIDFKYSQLFSMDTPNKITALKSTTDDDEKSINQILKDLEFNLQGKKLSQLNAFEIDQFVTMKFREKFDVDSIKSVSQKLIIENGNSLFLERINQSKLNSKHFTEISEKDNFFFEFTSIFNKELERIRLKK